MVRGRLWINTDPNVPLQNQKEAFKYLHGSENVHYLNLPEFILKSNEVSAGSGRQVQSTYFNPPKSVVASLQSAHFHIECVLQ